MPLRFTEAATALTTVASLIILLFALARDRREPWLSGPRGAAPAWREWLVIVPERDGTTRIDDILFSTRRSDTLRARLGIMGAE